MSDFDKDKADGADAYASGVRERELDKELKKPFISLISDVNTGTRRALSILVFSLTAAGTLGYAYVSEVGKASVPKKEDSAVSVQVSALKSSDVVKSRVDATDFEQVEKVCKKTYLSECNSDSNNFAQLERLLLSVNDTDALDKRALRMYYCRKLKAVLAKEINGQSPKPRNWPFVFAARQKMLTKQCQ